MNRFRPERWIKKYIVLIIVNEDDLGDRHVGVYESIAAAHAALVEFVNESPVADPKPLDASIDDDIVRAFDLIATETPYRVCIESGVGVGESLVLAIVQ